MTGRPIIELTAFASEYREQTGKVPEFLVLLSDGTVRTAAWTLGTILLGPFGRQPQPEQWPTHFMPLPSASEFLDDQR